MTTQDDQLVDPDILDRVKGWRDYVEAKLGFRNHWYPVLLSDEVEEGKPVTAKLCGENLLLNRIDGEVHCIRDRCLHRGVKFSKKPECHTKATITCWYHGYTYRWADGKLTDVIAAPETRIVDGTRGVRSYIVEEAKGLVFVFLGDRDGNIPPLIDDVPPNFLDEDNYVLSQRQTVQSNWRHGVENGFDKTHIYIHRESLLIQENDLVLPLGFGASGEQSHELVDGEDGPRGVIEIYGPHVIPAFEGKIEGETVLKVPSDVTGKNLVPSTISMWMPCALKVDPWPDPKTTQFEWYVPIDETTHMYFQNLGTRAETDEEKRDFKREYNNRWAFYALEEFNGPDIWAREAAEEGYADDHQWVDEALFEADENIIVFRRLISKRNRGVQRPSDLRA
ncbi:Rieske 2Fe-2S domain-containing protein [Parasphingopyxis lamellibrachiae]|uniref:Carbazole 1,9a-dioxygenase terminal dioxygenase component n=1 Tax=Parasphingopyxis lamellibrachiae TaxID=680125 RepID=A0A3D9F8A0_9SPHN|nr:Rieske 2Fe-2S domain-containing protein [Parasphingopyxis lamellibrachiae]RED13355.1 carbazole 1,9a-dioxygenase terminal dioxygenase component [Parasphingopyxis lamellibrachiae]